MQRPAGAYYNDWIIRVKQEQVKQDIEKTQTVVEGWDNEKYDIWLPLEKYGDLDKDQVKRPS